LERFLEYVPSAQEHKEAVEAMTTIFAINAFGKSLPSKVQDRALATSFQAVMRSLDRLLDAFDPSQAMLSAPMAQGDQVSAYVDGLSITVQA
jgi:hypothetical protein